jgi:hypothetical protein
MTEPSKQALEQARVLLCDTEGAIETIVATALQELMDERDDWRRRYSQNAGKFAAQSERAEKAEADYLQVAEVLGYVNRPEGQGGVEVGPVELLVSRIRELNGASDRHLDAEALLETAYARGELLEERLTDMKRGVADALRFLVDDLESAAREILAVLLDDAEPPSEPSPAPAAELCGSEQDDYDSYQRRKEYAAEREPGCQCQWEAGDSPCPVHDEDEVAP